MKGRLAQSSTVIIFAREPVPGKTKTRLAARVGAVSAAVLADAFLRDTLAKVAALQTRLVIAADTPHGVGKSRYFRALARSYGAVLIDQCTGELGARMSNALRPYAADGGAILIGGDVPSLPSDHIARAVKLIREFDAILGPTLDGGYYLLGVRGALPKIFNRMPWGYTGVFRESIRRLRTVRSRYTVAPCWYDVDDIHDLIVLNAHLFSQGELGRKLSRYLPLGRRCPCRITAKVLAKLGNKDGVSA
jgi:rSAM/selenodomain-associated transferase 1